MESARLLQNKRILVVEDEYLLAMDLAKKLRELGAIVIGPASTVARALELAEGPLDVALLDVNVRNEPVYPVADKLRSMGAPFAFATGYESHAIAEQYADAPLIEKPFVIQDLAAALVRLLHRPKDR